MRTSSRESRGVAEGDERRQRRDGERGSLATLHRADWAIRTEARSERRGANEAALRSETAAASGPFHRLRPFLCECSQAACDGVVWLTAAEFAAARRASGRFVVLPGHERDDADIVVGRIGSHVLVERAPSELFLG